MIDSVQGPLRITVDDTHKVLTLRLEGRVAGAMAEELRQTWSDLCTGLGERPLVIDLRDAIYIDAKGLVVLAEIHRNSDAKFQADSPLTQYFADQAAKLGGSDGN